MNYKFQVGELVRRDSGELGLVTGLDPIAVTGRRSYGHFRYTVLIQGVTYKLYGYELRKVSESNEVSV